MDAAYYGYDARSVQHTLRAAGCPRLGDLADAFIPNRYKRYYVEAAFGSPVLSGRQLLQDELVNLRFVSSRSSGAEAAYDLRTSWIVMQAAGRSEERIGYPTMVTPDRDGWLGSDHVMRVIARDNRTAPWLYIALANEPMQLAIKALACGSVVDKTYPDELLTLHIPPPPPDDVAESVAEAWTLFAVARHVEAAAVARFAAHVSLA